MTTHAGSCHCGTVRFSVDWAITELTTCDCSLCAKKNAVMTQVPDSALTILQGQDRLTLYQWNTRVARHYFCSVCGIYVFHRKRSAPDHYGINIFCLEGIDAAALPRRVTPGATMTIADPAGRPDWPGPRTGTT